MYYPYLRGRQNELMALRNFSEELDVDSKISPIIEPVRQNTNVLVKATQSLNEKNIAYSVILNPEYGDFENQIIRVRDIEGFPLTSNFHPAFILGSLQPRAIKDIIEGEEYNNVVLILPRTATVEEKELTDLFNSEKVFALVTDVSRRSAIHGARTYNKSVIRLDDKFEKRSSGREYLSIDEELFTEEFAYYEEDRYQGFGDYTVLPNEFNEGGTLPVVLVIHLTYKKDAHSVYVKHFCSNGENRGKANIQGKFAEAAQKALAFFESIHYSTNALDVLRSYIEQGKFPGLGMIKKISILHHIELMQDILNHQL